MAISWVKVSEISISFFVSKSQTLTQFLRFRPEFLQVIFSGSEIFPSFIKKILYKFNFYLYYSSFGEVQWFFVCIQSPYRGSVIFIFSCYRCCQITTQSHNIFLHTTLPQPSTYPDNHVGAPINTMNNNNIKNNCGLKDWQMTNIDNILKQNEELVQRSIKTKTRLITMRSKPDCIMFFCYCLFHFEGIIWGPFL